MVVVVATHSKNKRKRRGRILFFLPLLTNNRAKIYNVVGRFAILAADEAALLRAVRINSLRFGRFPLAPRAQSSWFRSFKAATPGSVKRAGVPKGEKHGGGRAIQSPRLIIYRAGRCVNRDLSSFNCFSLARPRNGISTTCSDG